MESLIAEGASVERPFIGGEWERSEKLLFALREEGHPDVCIIQKQIKHCALLSLLLREEDPETREIIVKAIKMLEYRILSNFRIEAQSGLFESSR